jgi:hypothetical protein
MALRRSITTGPLNPTESCLVPSLRLISVAVLVGAGAVVAVSGVAGNSQPAGTALVRGSRIVASASASPGPTTPAALDVKAENALAGTPGWRISRAAGQRAGLQAYAGAVSVRPGEQVPLLVSAEGVVQVKAFRIGWYGGIGARQVWQGSLRARPEPADPSLWQARGWAVTTGWPEGHYLLRLDLIGAGAGSKQVSRYLPLTIRSADSRGRIMVLTSPLSWQAENTAVAGARTASFNRPYAAGYGSGSFLPDDEGLVESAERSGKRLAYATDYDVATDPSLVSKASAVLVGAGSRFWTTSLRSTIRAVGDAGTNLAFFGAGTGSRQVSLTDKGRTLKISPGAPSESVRLTGQRPSCLDGISSTGQATPTTAVTTSSSPKASSSTAGSADGNNAAGWTVSNADWWGYRGTGVQTGEILPGLIADGADRASTTSAGSVSPMQVLAFTNISCGPGGSGPAGDVQSAVYQVRPSKAGVFAAGTGRWVCVITATCVGPSGAKVAAAQSTRHFVVQVTANLISAFAKPRAGERYPARDSAAQYALLR